MEELLTEFENGIHDHDHSFRRVIWTHERVDLFDGPIENVPLDALERRGYVRQGGQTWAVFIAGLRLVTSLWYSRQENRSCLVAED